MNKHREDNQKILDANEFELITLSDGRVLMGCFPSGTCPIDQGSCRINGEKCHLIHSDKLLPPCAVIMRQPDGMLFRLMKLSESTPVDLPPGQRVISETVLGDLVAATETWNTHLVEMLGVDHPSCIALRELLTTVEFAAESLTYQPTRVLGPADIAVNRDSYAKLLLRVKGHLRAEMARQVDNPMHGGKPDQKTNQLYLDVVAASNGLPPKEPTEDSPGGPRCEQCPCYICQANSLAHCDFCDKAPE
jgi:hypothetical protein